MLPALPSLASQALTVSAAGRALLTGAATAAEGGLGPSTGFAVLDAATGQTLYSADADRPRTPASTLKLLTTAAALEALGPGTRLATTVQLAPDGTVVLVGGGDPTLTAEPTPAATARGTGDDAGTSSGVPGPRHPAALDRPASLRQLAAATASRLKALSGSSSSSAGAAPVRVAVDDSLFTGPAAAPTWPQTYLTGGVVSRVSALSVDEARLSGPSPTGEYEESKRAPDPAVAAGEAFAKLLAEQGVTVAPGPIARLQPPPGSQQLAAVFSPPVRRLVERTLTLSDNDLAEALLRLVGRATGHAASFEGGAAGVQGVLTTLGVPTPGLVQLDGSGLSRDNRVAAVTLAGLLRATASDAHPELRAVLTGLPVAGFTGTLSDRFGANGAAGVVRAKTGTLTGVSTLAGTLVDQDGRQLVFAVLADRVAVTGRARAALDAFATGLHRCGCLAPTS